jgi:hypothetical protein
LFNVGVFGNWITRFGPMKTKLLPVVVLLLLHCAGASAEELVYHGKWSTTNRKLDGLVTCVVTPIENHKWQGRFYGTWQGVEFDYLVNFVGTANELEGTARIDGATYNWRGWITPQQFKANFSGDRYAGSFDLQRTKTPGKSQR